VWAQRPADAVDVTVIRRPSPYVVRSHRLVSVEHPDQRRRCVACAGAVRCIWLFCGWFAIGACYALPLARSNVRVWIVCCCSRLLDDRSLLQHGQVLGGHQQPN